MNKVFMPEALVPILADLAVSITDLKRNPASVITAARERQVAVLSHNKPVAYVVSPKVWAHVLDVFADRRIEREAFEALDAADEDGESVTIDLDAYLQD